MIALDVVQTVERDGVHLELEELGKYSSWPKPAITTPE